MRIGFLGLGNMGQAMARNLLRAGHQLMVFNRTRKAAELLGKQGADIADSPAQAAAQEIVITMLANDVAVESVVMHGVLDGMARGALHISMSTISPDLSQRLSIAHQQRGHLYVAAPVFGRPEAAEAAKLFIVAAGSHDALAKAAPVFLAIGQRTFEVSDHPEQANLNQLCGNFMNTCALESLGEVFAVSRKAHIDPHTLFKVLSSTLFGAPVYNNYAPRIIDEKFSPAGFTMPLGIKDVRLMLQAAENLSVPMPFASVVRDRFISAIANGYADLDWSAITLDISHSAGLPTRAGVSHSDAAD